MTELTHNFPTATLMTNIFVFWKLVIFVGSQSMFYHVARHERGKEAGNSYLYYNNTDEIN